MSTGRAEVALPTAAGARRVFDRAAATFDSARFLHDEARRRMLARLDYVRLEPRLVVDLGCATGAGTLALAERYAGARVAGVDISEAMLRLASRRCGEHARIGLLSGAAERLPLLDRSVDLLFTNLVLPWCEPRAMLSEAARVLADGGLLAFSTLGPDTLREVRRAWAEVDDVVHVHGFLDMHDIGDLAVAAGLAEPVVDVDRIELTYRDVAALAADLRAAGAVNVAPGRRHTLTGPRRWRRFEARLLEQRRGDRFAVTIELVLGSAWGTGREARGRASPGEVGVPIDRIGRRFGR